MEGCWYILGRSKQLTPSPSFIQIIKQSQCGWTMVSEGENDTRSVHGLGQRKDHRGHCKPKESLWFLFCFTASP